MTGQVRIAPRYRGQYSVAGCIAQCQTVDKGDTIVILHSGPGLDHTYLQPQLDVLAAHHTLLYYDQRGTGRSTGEVDTIHCNVGRLIALLLFSRPHLAIC